MIRLKPYQLCVLGDNPGQNTQTGKFKSPNCNSLCRVCDIVKGQLSDPWKMGNLVTEQDVQDWQCNPIALLEHSYKKVDNAWNYMYFAGDIYGIHGSSPGEIVHALQLGIMQMTLDGLYCTRALTAVQQESNSKIPVQDDNVDILIDAPEEDVELKKKILKRKSNVVRSAAGMEENLISSLSTWVERGNIRVTGTCHHSTLPRVLPTDQKRRQVNNKEYCYSPT